MATRKSGRKTVEALPVFISSSLGLLYMLLFLKNSDIVLIVIFLLLIMRSVLGMLR